jgi:hypothetical protein
MNPVLLAAIVSLVEEAIIQEPKLVAEFKNIFGKSNPTTEDWNTLRDKVLSKNYSDYVPGTELT